MSIPLIICLIFFLAVVVMLKKTKKKNADAHEAGLKNLSHGTKIRTISGMLGTVVEVGNDSIKADFSPDNSGSVIEITKDAFYKIEE